MARDLSPMASGSTMNSGPNQNESHYEFDVFLCHNSEDKPEVKRIADELKRRGLRPWLDDWELLPGLSWIRQLQQQIGRVRCAAVLVGEAGHGPWQKEEQEALLVQFVKQNAPIIPVLLPSDSYAVLRAEACLAPTAD